MRRPLLWVIGSLCLLLSAGCVRPQQVVRRNAQPPARRTPPPPPIRRTTKTDPYALGKVTSGRYAMSRLGKWFHGKSQGNLAPTQVTPLIDRARPAMSRCITQFKQRFPTGAEGFKMRLWIGPQGRVWKSLFAGDVNADPRTIRCLRSVLHRIQFLHPGGFFVWTQQIGTPPDSREAPGARQ